MINKKLPERPKDIPEPKEGWTYVGPIMWRFIGHAETIALFQDDRWIYHSGCGFCGSHYAVRNDAPYRIWKRFGFTGNPLTPEDPLLKDILSTQRELSIKEGILRDARQSLSTHLTNHYGQGIPLQGNPRVQEALEYARGILNEAPEPQEDQVWVLKPKRSAHDTFPEFRAHSVYLRENEGGTLDVWGKDENKDILWYLTDILWFYRKDTIKHKKEQV